MMPNTTVRAASRGEPSKPADSAGERTTAEGGSRLRRISFLAVLALTSLFLLVALLPAYPLIAINWLPDDLWLAVRTDRVAGDQIHRLHSLALGIIAWTMLVGVGVQFHRARRKLAALLMALAAPVALALGEAMAGTYTVMGTVPFLTPLLLIAVLHPARGDLIRVPRMNPFMGVLAAATALPCILFALHLGEAGRMAGADGDVEHLTFVAALSILVALWAVIGAFDWPGWTFAAAAAVVAAASIGLQSLIFSDVLSAMSRPWAIAALAWCVGYAAAGILRTRRGRNG